MQLSRPTLSTVGVTVALAALVVGVIVSIDERHHHQDSTPPSTSGLVQLPATALAQQLRFAQRLNNMALPKGVVHTTTCPRDANPADACFATAVHTPVRTDVTAAGDTQSLMSSLHIKPASLIACTSITGGQQGSGYNCTMSGTWRGATVAVTAFVSNAAHKFPDPRGLDALVSVQSVQPS